MATLKIPNYIVTVMNPKGTSRTRYAPKYEVLLLKKIFAGTAPGKKDPEVQCKKMPEAGTKAARDPVTGRDRFAGLRHTRVAHLQAEKDRLRNFYGDRKIGNNTVHIFDTVFPLDTFENQARLFYPDIFGKAQDAYAIDETPADEDTEEAVEDVIEEVEAPETETENESSVVVPEEAIDELMQLKYVGEATAKGLYLAGFTNVEEIAQTDPLDIEATVKGVGLKEAKAMVEHAIELSKDSDDDISDIME